MSFRSNLDPELAPGVAFFEALGLVELTLASIPARRAEFKQMFTAMRAMIPANPNVTHEDRRIPGPAGAPELLVRIYRPVAVAAAPALRPCLYWIHGGGMILGDIGMDDANCAAYAEQLGCVVVSVEYRLAPEHPHPAPVEDCYAGLTWTAEHAKELGIDRARIAIAGASAGAGLAAGTALVARDRGGPALIFQCLIYPMLDDRNITESSREFSAIPSWSRESNLVGWSALLGDEMGKPGVSPYAAPSRATDLSRLPPAIVQVGELEVFRDEDIEYATRLMQAGVPAELHVYPGAVHGWDSMVPMAGVSKRMVADRMSALQRAFGGSSQNG
jgi:acetyl esterase/lipase